MYDHGELWWNDMNRGRLVIRLPELFGNSISSLLAAKQEELAKEIMNFALQCILHLKGIFNVL
jgi:hypothetical protein